MVIVVNYNHLQELPLLPLSDTKKANLLKIGYSAVAAQRLSSTSVSQYPAELGSASTFCPDNTGQPPSMHTQLSYPQSHTSSTLGRRAGYPDPRKYHSPYTL